MEINEHIKKRWSPRAFLDKDVEQEKLEVMFEAARWAPSSMNGQPWRFLYARKGEEGYKNIFDTLAEGNQVWAGKAPVLMVVIGKTKFDYKERPNKHAWYDSGQAMANFSIQATELGLHLHQMGGFDPKKIKETFQMEEEYDPIAVVAVGYKGDPGKLPEKLENAETAERKRKPLEEVVFHNEWKN